MGEILGKLWNDLSLEDKQVYKDKHDKEMHEFYEKHPEERGRKKSKKNNKWAQTPDL